jgi:hypothetical protein
MKTERFSITAPCAYATYGKGVLDLPK